MSSRYDGARARGLFDRPLGEQTPAQKRIQDELAREAEERVCAFFGAKRLGSLSGRPDRGYDLIIPKTGEPADVKFTRTLPGERFGSKGVGYPTLNLSTWKRQRAIVYILVIGGSTEEMDRYAWAAGYARIDELLAAPIVSGRYGRPYHALGFDYLHPLEELLP